jgi:hypothetical protein
MQHERRFSESREHDNRSTCTFKIADKLCFDGGRVCKQKNQATPVKACSEAR